MYPVFKVCFWEWQFPYLIPFRGCPLKNLVRYLLFSVLFLIGKKNVAATYITWGLFRYRSCSKRQAVWLGGFGVTHIHYHSRKAFQLSSTTHFSHLQAAKKLVSSLAIPRASSLLGASGLWLGALGHVKIWGVSFTRAGQSWQHCLPTFTIPEYL